MRENYCTKEFPFRGGGKSAVETVEKVADAVNTWYPFALQDIKECLDTSVEKSANWTG